MVPTDIRFLAWVATHPEEVRELVDLARKADRENDENDASYENGKGWRPFDAAMKRHFGEEYDDNGDIDNFFLKYEVS